LTLEKGLCVTDALRLQRYIMCPTVAGSWL